MTRNYVSKAPRKTRIPPVRNGVWTEERVAQLTKYVSEGLSFGLIGQRMRLSRCSVLGKAYRLGIKHPDAASKPRQVLPAPGPYSKTPRPPRPPVQIRHQAKVFGETRVKTVVVRKQVIIAGCGAVIEKPAGRLSPMPPVDASAWAPLPGSSPVLLVDRQPYTCRWPIDIAGEDIARMCGERADGDRYCPHHSDRETSGRVLVGAEALEQSLRRYAA